MPQENLIYGRRVVLEELKAGSHIDRIALRVGAGGEIIREILRTAKASGVRVDRLPADIFDRKIGRIKGAGGIAAYTSAVKTYDLLQILDNADRAHFITVLDGIEDPQNLGAIARSAEAAGCTGMVISRRRSAPLSDAAMKASAGALAHISVARVTNIAVSLDILKKRGIWVYGAEMSGIDYRKVDYAADAALVVGSEGKGISRLVKEKCDQLIAIPLKGKIASLNASVSAGILLFHIAGAREINTI